MIEIGGQSRMVFSALPGKRCAAGMVHRDAALLHHFGQVTVADAAFAMPAHANEMIFAGSRGA
jgi:hypothetical protein